MEISDAWVRAPIGQVTVTAGYLTLTNTSGVDDVLVAIETDAAAKTDVHEVSEGEGGMMRMRPVAKLPVPAGKTITLKSGSDHLMLMGLGEGVEDGTSITLRLTFQHAGTVEIVAPVARRDPNL